MIDFDLPPAVPRLRRRRYRKNQLGLRPRRIDRRRRRARDQASVLGLVGAIAIVIVAVEGQLIEVAPVVIYIFGLVAMLVLSAAYNMWPISTTKWVLRRFDHSAIYLLIAGHLHAVPGA